MKNRKNRAKNSKLIINNYLENRFPDKTLFTQSFESIYSKQTICLNDNHFLNMS